MARSWLAGAQAAGRGDGDAGVDTALEAGDADHEEFTRLEAKIAAKLQRSSSGWSSSSASSRTRWLNFSQLSSRSKIAIRGQRLFAGLRLALVGFVCLGYVLGDLAAQDSL